MDLFRIIRSPKGDNFENYISSISMPLLNVLDDSSGDSLLHAAIGYKQDRIALDLISKGIDVNHQNGKGKTALHFAAAHSNYEIASEIIKKGGDVNLRDSFENNSLWTATFNAKGNYQIVKLFLEAGGDPNHKNTSNRSALDFAIQIKDEELISLLESR